MKFLTTKEVAEIISERTGQPMSQRQVQTEIKGGKIKAEKVGHVYLVKESDLENYKRRKPGKRLINYK